MAEYIKKEDALLFSFANGQYDHKNADEHFIFGCETYKEWLEQIPAADAITMLCNLCADQSKINSDAIAKYLTLWEKQQRWIPVTERLPEPYTWVLVSAEEDKVAFDAFYDGAQWKDAFLNCLIVTHWMPLPEPPKEE